MLGKLLNRPLITSCVGKKCVMLLSQFEEELDTIKVRVLFLSFVLSFLNYEISNDCMINYYFQLL